MNETGARVHPPSVVQTRGRERSACRVVEPIGYLVAEYFGPRNRALVQQYSEASLRT
jgi:hypothetical protein